MPEKAYIFKPNNLFNLSPRSIIAILLALLLSTVCTLHIELDSYGFKNIYVIRSKENMQKTQVSLPCFMNEAELQLLVVLSCLFCALILYISYSLGWSGPDSMRFSNYIEHTGARAHNFILSIVKSLNGNVVYFLLVCAVS